VTTDAERDAAPRRDDPMTRTRFLSFERQVAKAYRQMARQVRSRPAAPFGDGMGYITVPESELDIDAEILTYARRWAVEEEACTYDIGCPDHLDRVALIYVIEAARMLCGMEPHRAVRLLRMAAADIETRMTPTTTTRTETS
jgi:hypothetical protein